MTSAEKLVRLLQKRRLTVTTAESCTGGLVSALLTAVPGASDVLEGALVAYSPRIKQSFLGVSPEIIESTGVVSPECASAMAEGAKQAFSADCAMALTGYAGPGGGDECYPVGTVWIAAAAPGLAQPALRCIHVEGDREAVRHGAAQAVIALLTELLEKSESPAADGE